MLVFDVTRKQSFENIPRWLRELRDHANRDIVLVLVGNKADLIAPGGGPAPAPAAVSAPAAAADGSAPVTTDADGTLAVGRQVTEEEARRLAAECQIPYFETSAKSGLNVDGAFNDCVRAIYQTAFKARAPAAGMRDPPAHFHFGHPHHCCGCAIGSLS
jgi:Ras-related protein Rab-5C